jgi:uncharacterized surface protein with fasciclin (FAS1) repeats
MLKGTILGALCLTLAACGDGGTGNEAAKAGGADANETAAAPAEAPPLAGKSLLDSLAASPDFATLASAVKAAGLTETFSGSQPYTLFAPTEAAFQKLPAGTMAALLGPEGKGRLTALLTNHIVPGTITSEDLGRAIERGKGKAQLATMGGANLSVSRAGEAIVVSDTAGGQGRVAGATTASNGVIHPLDAVMMPR